MEELMDAAKSADGHHVLRSLAHKCHRRLIADALLARGWQVRYLSAPNELTIISSPFARVETQTSRISRESVLRNELVIKNQRTKIPSGFAARLVLSYLSSEFLDFPPHSR
jgi:hypothetical protein